MKASNAQLARQNRGNEPGLITLITSSKLWPLHQDSRAVVSELQSPAAGSDGINRKEPNFNFAGPAETLIRSEEPPAESQHDRRLRFIEEHHKNGLLEQKVETMRALLSDMTRQRDNWQVQAERSFASFQETQQELLRFVRQAPDSQRKQRKRGFFGLFKKSP